MATPFAVVTLLIAGAVAKGDDGSDLPRAPASQPLNASEAYALGKRGVEAFAGCYLVDYSYVETESFQADYARDPRVYDVNARRSVKEWIAVEALSQTRLWV